jgi:hypothetical protein
MGLPHPPNRSIIHIERRTRVLVVCRGARHDEQKVRKPVHNLLPRRLTRRDAVPRKPDRARHPRGGEQRPTTTRRPALAWEPSRRQVRRRPVHADDGRVYGRLSHTQELPRNLSVPRERRWSPPNAPYHDDGGEPHDGDDPPSAPLPAFPAHTPASVSQPPHCWPTGCHHSTDAVC